jgi:hypothetical protein
MSSLCGMLTALWLCAAAANAADIGLSVDKTALSVTSGDAFVFTLAIPRPTDVAVKVYDGSGKFVRTLWEKYTTDTQAQVPWNMKDDAGAFVGKGTYTVRMETGFGLAIDKSFGKDGVLTGSGTTAFISPWDIVTDATGDIYLLDGGAATVYKFKPDGSPANDFAGKNTIIAPKAPLWDSLAVGADGRLYLPDTRSTSHVIEVRDPKSGAVIYTIGGFGDVRWKTEKGSIAYPTWVGINGDHLYATSPAYMIFCAWDSRKPGKTGALWITPPSGVGDAGATDGKKAIYLASAYWAHKAELGKYLDQDEWSKPCYTVHTYFDPGQNKTVTLDDINGVACDGERGLFLVERAPVKILKFFDKGAGLDFVTSFGKAGNDAEKLEFVAPHSAAVSPDGKALYVAEDGEVVSKENTAHGLARLVKYDVRYAAEKEVKVTVNP